MVCSCCGCAKQQDSFGLLSSLSAALDQKSGGHTKDLHRRCCCTSHDLQLFRLLLMAPSCFAVLPAWGDPQNSSSGCPWPEHCRVCKHSELRAGPAAADSALLLRSVCIYNQTVWGQILNPIQAAQLLCKTVPQPAIWPLTERLATRYPAESMVCAFQKLSAACHAHQLSPAGMQDANVRQLVEKCYTDG